MPFARPTLAALRDRIRQDFTAKLPGADALLRASNLRVVADVEAQLANLLFGYLEWLARQLFPDSAETVFLDRWASIWGVLRKPATAAVGQVAATGLANAVVPAGTEWQRQDGVRYATDADTLLAADGTGFVPVTAVVPATGGNAAAGVQVRTVQAVVGLVAQGTVADPGVAGGADLETDDALRARLALRIQLPPHGGDAADYLMWTLEVPGVTRAWVYPMELGPGTVTVRFMLDDVRAPTGIPTAADVALVQAHLDAVRPVTAEVIVVAPVPTPLAVTIRALTPDTPAVRAAVAAELTDVLRRNAIPGATIYASWLWEAVSVASGERHHTLVAPPGDVVEPSGALAILGPVTYLDA